MPANLERIAIVDGDILTSFGHGINCCFDGLLEGRRALSHDDALVCTTGSGWLGRVSGINETETRFDALLDALAPDLLAPETDIRILLASTLGNAPTANTPDRPGFALPGVDVFSAACASSSAALCFAADLLATGRETAVRVVAADALSEFVYSGFASLGALDMEPSRPFDTSRAGLNLGEAAGWMLLMTESRARSEGRAPRGYLAGWGQRNDAHHLTAPHREARGLIASIQAARERADSRGAAYPVVTYCAHGTGTRYNDAMEMKAAKACFSPPVPLWSVKGAIGHTLGASGLVETWLALHALERGVAPMTVGCTTPECPDGGVTLHNTPVTPDGLALTTNSGFGGINAALLLQRGDAP
ncbi:MAG: beta-ketoacyl-[acyl-carrier-protein] synthase family protein [Kiritimatiellae bacterium]|nr:beta-ketoacyl-[acyl-carrier-protein] synthase family protein [Kiritimatiellia bacterium]